MDVLEFTVVFQVCFGSRQMTVTVKQWWSFGLLFQGTVCEIPYFNDI